MTDQSKGNENSRRGRPRKNQDENMIPRCWECSFESPRTYNVLRHHQRIHQPTEKWINCCDLKFNCKSDYYWHCVEFHPKKRKHTIMSTFKYKITKENGDKENENLENKQFDKRKLRRKIRKVSVPEESSIEANDVESNLSEKSERPKSKGVKIFFPGGMKNVSPELQADYLTDIDFESFKLALPSEREKRLSRRNSIRVEIL